MELFRLWGLESAVRAHELPAQARRFLWLESMQGRIMGEVNLNESAFDDSPTRSCFVTQDFIEQELLNTLLQHSNSTIKFSTQLRSFQQHKDFVECELFNKNTQTSETISCQYLVAADGSHSFIRNSLNIKMQGIENMSRNLSVLCDADLSSLLSDKFFDCVGFYQKIITR